MTNGQLDSPQDPSRINECATWVRLRQPEEIAGPARAVLDAGVSQYGQVLNTWAAILHRPEIFETYLPFLRSVAGTGVLDPKAKDLSALLVGFLNNCRYTVSHRTASAKRNGATEDEIIAVVTGQWEQFDQLTQEILSFTQQLSLCPPELPFFEAPQIVDQDLLKTIAARLNDAERVELAMSVSVWNALSRFHRVMGFALDMPEPPDPADPARHAAR